MVHITLYQVCYPVVCFYKYKRDTVNGTVLSTRKSQKRNGCIGVSPGGRICENSHLMHA